MILTQNPTQSTGSRAMQRIAVAGGAAAIAAIAFSGAASALPYSYNNDFSFGHTTVGGQVSGNVPSPGNHSLTLGGSVGVTNTLGGATVFGPNIQIALNPAHPLKPTVLVGGTAGTTHFGGIGGNLTGGISNGHPSLHFTPF